MRPWTPLLLVAVSLSGSLVLAACEKEKSKAEKLAEELAASNSAVKASVSASVSQVDPAEQKYADRKKSLEQTAIEMKADESRMMNADPASVPGGLRKYFPAGADGDAAFKTLDDKCKKLKVDGIRITKTTIKETRLQGNLEDAEIEVLEEAAGKGSTNCFLYTQVWKWDGTKWLWKSLKAGKPEPCG